MLKIHSIYTSISGEVGPILQGRFITIVRVAGCNLRCEWPCDAIDARDGVGSEQEISVVADHIRVSGNINVLITGGEPLLQIDGIAKLILELGNNYNVFIETNGTIPPHTTPFFDNVDFVVDYKMPYSGHYFDMKLENYKHLKPWDIVKFVCDSENDVRTAIAISKLLLKDGCVAKMAIGQTWNWLQEKSFDLVNFLIREDCKYFIINCQIHRALNCE